jgi:hypothetical protein
MIDTPKIVRILDVQPFWIALLWSNDEIRLNDFPNQLDQWMQEGSAAYQIFSSNETFLGVTVSQNGSLAWPALFEQTMVAGERLLTTLELDRSVLYADSQFIEMHLN